MTTVLFHPKAQAEYSESFSWYEAQRSGLGTSFELAVETLLDRLIAHPEYYGKAVAGYRKALVNGFPCTVIYKYIAARELIYIASIYHHSLNPKGKYRPFPE